MSTKPMREIKFRAYFNGEMLKVDTLGLTKAGVTESYMGIKINIPFQPTIPLMQYTGLKDKNGKDVYEGDVLDAYYDDEFKKPNRIVWWFNPQSRFVSTTIKEYLTYQKDSSNKIWICNAGKSANWGWGEIIGNIYEHPHLLENNHE